jgi:hypothetical protein
MKREYSCRVCKNEGCEFFKQKAVIQGASCERGSMQSPACFTLLMGCASHSNFQRKIKIMDVNEDKL